MLSFSQILLLVFAGGLGGFFSGFLGVGGGIIFVPFLDYYFRKMGIPDAEIPRYLLANSFFIIIFTGLLSSYKQFRYGNLFPKQTLYTAIPGMITCTALTILILFEVFPYDSKSFSIVFILMLLYVAARMFMNNESSTLSGEELRADSTSLKKFSYIGAFTGVWSALSGLGGGLLMVPLFMKFIRIDIKKSTGISTGVVPFLALPMAAFYMLSQPENNLPFKWSAGYVLFALTLPMIFGVIFMAPQGVKTARKVDAKTIRIIFACVILASTAKMVWNLI